MPRKTANQNHFTIVDVWYTAKGISKVYKYHMEISAVQLCWLNVVPSHVCMLQASENAWYYTTVKKSICLYYKQTNKCNLSCLYRFSFMEHSAALRPDVGVNILFSFSHSTISIRFQYSCKHTSVLTYEQKRQQFETSSKCTRVHCTCMLWVINTFISMLCRIVLPGGSTDSFIMKHFFKEVISPTCLHVRGWGAAACLLLWECVLFTGYSVWILMTNSFLLLFMLVFIS